MKTLKKVLAVVLALAMMLGMTVTASAAFEDETVTYKEAVDVMNAVGVMVGDANGKFNPTANLTRAEAVTVINRALKSLGFEIKMPNITLSFPDLSEEHWAYSEIMYAANK